MQVVCLLEVVVLLLPPSNLGASGRTIDCAVREPQVGFVVPSGHSSSRQ